MKHLLLFFTISFVLLLGCKSTSKVVEASNTSNIDVPTETTQLTYTEWSDALLWKVTRDDITVEPSYVFGTIHMIDKEKFFYPNGTLEALGSSQEVLFEIDMDAMSNVANQMSMIGKIMMKDGVTLKDLLSDEDYTMVAAFFDKKGLPMMFANKIKPMFLSSMTEMDMGSMDMFGGGGGESDVKSYEMEMYAYAEEKGIEVGGLETMDYQIGIFDSIPYEAQAKMLVEAVEQSGSADADRMMDDLIRTYLSQDIDGLVQAFSDDDEFAEFESILLNDRNHNWIPIIKEKFAVQPTFVAVGAGHLAGPEGVLHLLRRQGYTITPISSK